MDQWECSPRNNFPIRWVALVAVLLLGSANAVAQTPVRNPGQEAAKKQAISQDVSRPFGDYRYVPQTGLYKDVTFGDRVEDFKEGAGKVGAFVNNLNVATGWSQYNPDGLSYTLWGGVNQIRLPGGGIYYGSPFTGTTSGNLQLRIWPFIFDNFYLGYGLLYDDIQGNFPGREQLPPDDRWAQIVTLSFRASLTIGNTVGISIQPYLYWLPNKGEVGWGIPGPLAGFGNYQPNLNALLTILWNKQVGNWNLSVTDMFSPRIYQYNLWNIFVNSSSGFGDLSPIDRVGRYGLGNGAGDLSNYSPQARANVHPGDWKGFAGYYNVLGSRAVGTLGYDTKSLLYLYRTDFWDSHFRGDFATVSGGAYLQKGNPYFSVYGGYSFSTSQPFNTYLHWTTVGAIKRIGASTSVYAQGGYYWYTGQGDGGTGALATLGIVQRVGLRTNHYAEVGRRIYTPPTGPAGIEDYIDYRINHMLGSRTSIAGFVGTAKVYTREQGNSFNVKYAGLILNYLVSSRTSTFASSGWARSETGSVNSYINDTWTHRFGLHHNLTENIQFQAYYQYMDVRSNTFSNNYSEHFIYIGALKRF